MVEILVGVWVGYNADLVINVDVVINTARRLMHADIPEDIAEVATLRDLFDPQAGLSFHRLSKADYSTKFRHFEFPPGLLSPGCRQDW
jgi:hypothetical protein